MVGRWASFSQRHYVDYLVCYQTTYSSHVRQQPKLNSEFTVFFTFFLLNFYVNLKFFIQIWKPLKITKLILEKNRNEFSAHQLIIQKWKLYVSPVHLVLVSLLVDQLSGLFLTFFGRPKKILFSLREFLVRLWFFLVHQVSFWYTKISF